MDNVRLIDAKATHDKLIQHAMECAACGKLKEAADCVVAAGVLADETLATTIEAEIVRHGAWIDMVFTDTGKSAGYKCSECGLGARKKFAYCHCGAKMDREETEV